MTEGGAGARRARLHGHNGATRDERLTALCAGVALRETACTHPRRSVLSGIKNTIKSACHQRLCAIRPVSQSNSTRFGLRNRPYCMVKPAVPQRAPHPHAHNPHPNGNPQHMPLPTAAGIEAHGHGRRHIRKRSSPARQTPRHDADCRSPRTHAAAILPNHTPPSHLTTALPNHTKANKQVAKWQPIMPHCLTKSHHKRHFNDQIGILMH